MEPKRQRTDLMKVVNYFVSTWPAPEMLHIPNLKHDNFCDFQNYIDCILNTKQHPMANHCKWTQMQLFFVFVFTQSLRTHILHTCEQNPALCTCYSEHSAWAEQGRRTVSCTSTWSCNRQLPYCLSRARRWTMSLFLWLHFFPLGTAPIPLHSLKKTGQTIIRTQIVSAYSQLNTFTKKPRIYSTKIEEKYY